nr:thiamine-phosphate kinase [Janibacter alkaliphilus]
MGELGEDAVLAEVLAALGPQPGDVPVAAGDDAAVLATPSGSVVVTTDSMVRGLDWRDDWSTGDDVGQKVVRQNLADVAAMGAVPTGLVLALAADPATPMAWVTELARGVGRTSRAAGAAVIGGDLSGAPAGTVMVGVTAMGDLQGRDPVRRSGARPGDVVAVAGTLGRSGGGLALYLDGTDQGGGEAADELREVHRTALGAPLAAGPVAAKAGASAMIDVSDGLVQDLGRVAAASAVAVDLERAALTAVAAGPLNEVHGPERALHHVLAGGEEHALVATFAPVAVPTGWQVIGRVLDGPPGVTVDARAVEAAGWDHFRR